MKLPVFDGAEPLIYHRLTALGPAARRDRVLAAIEAGSQNQTQGSYVHNKAA